jgi:hypothetical protein
MPTSTKSGVMTAGYARAALARCVACGCARVIRSHGVRTILVGTGTRGLDLLWSPGSVSTVVLCCPVCPERSCRRSALLRVSRSRARSAAERAPRDSEPAGNAGLGGSPGVTRGRERASACRMRTHSRAPWCEHSCCWCGPRDGRSGDIGRWSEFESKPRTKTRWMGCQLRNE